MPSKERYVKAAQRAERMAAAKAYMEAHYLDTSLRDLAAHLGVCVSTVSEWAKKWGFGSKHLSRTQKDYIARIYPNATDKQLQRLADKMDISREALRVRAHRLGVRRSKDATSRQHSESGSHPKRRTAYSQEYIAAVREYYAGHTTRECAEHFGHSIGSFGHLVSMLGIRKRRRKE